MEVKISNIGNSKGIIIPKTIIEQCGLKERVNLEVKDNCLIVSSKSDVRQGWEEAIIAAGASNNDELLMGEDLERSWDEEEWSW